MFWIESVTQNGNVRYQTTINTKYLSVIVMNNNNIFVIYDNRDKFTYHSKWDETKKKTILKNIFKYVVDKKNIILRGSLMNSFYSMVEIGRREEIKQNIEINKFGDGFESD